MVCQYFVKAPLCFCWIHVQAMSHPCTEVFPGVDLPSHLGCAFWGGHLDASTMRNSQGLPACAKGSSKSHDYSPSRWALVTRETSEKHKSTHTCWQCQEPKLVFTLPDPAKKIKEAKIQTQKSEPGLTITHFTEGCLTSPKNSTWGRFNYQVSLGRFTTHKTLIYKQFFSYAPVPRNKVHSHRCVCTVRS